MLWINFLHCYQPVNVDAHIIEEATEKSYARIIRALEKNPNIKFTVNFTGCLFLRWKELGYTGLIRKIGRLLGRGQLELTGTAAYHPILPLIPVKEARRQIKENEKILRDCFGTHFKPKGFFSPEAAYSRETAKLIKSLGYDWILLDEIAYNGKLNRVNYNQTYQDATSGLKIIFRDRGLSKSYVPETILKLLHDSGKRNSMRNKIISTATDGELYGLRHEDPTGVLEKVLKEKKLKTALISEFINNRQAKMKIKPLDCSWESMENELKKNEPYILWADQKNYLQQQLWRLAQLAYRTIENNKKDKHYDWARWHLVRGLASCTFWWASAKDFRLFGPISWSPDEIERGTNELIRSIRALDNESTRDMKKQGEKLYIKIKHTIWDQHWTYYWKK